MTLKNNSYQIEKKKKFNGKSINSDILQKSLNFSFEMAFGTGFHRKYRSGGNKVRNKIEIFINTFQGKIAEFVVKEEFNNRGIECSEVDVEIYGKGIWDDGDLIVKGKKINIKSMAFFSNLLLLEKDDWDVGGIYLKGTENEVKYDYFIAVRIKPNIKDILKDVSDSITIEGINEILNKNKFYYDLPGVMSSETLTYLIRQKYIIKEGNKLNEKTILDADNYYIQNGDLKDFELLINELVNLC